MANITGSRITRMYSNFRGVDFRGEDINLARSPDCLNVWKDYKHTESIRTRPGMEIVYDFPRIDFGHGEPAVNVHAIYFFRGKMLVHYDGEFSEITEGVAMPIAAVNDAPSNGFVYEDIFYFMDGQGYYKYDGIEFEPVVGYVPTTSIARKPEGGGKAHEDVNMLSDFRFNTFLADGESTEFFLDTMSIDEDYQPEAWVNGEKTACTADFAKGKITFSTAPGKPLTDGQDNVRIKFKKNVPKYKPCITGCTLLQVFDNRVFISGNKDYPNYVWHCSLDDPTYFSDLDYYREGMDSAEIKGMVAGNNALWVFREPSDANTNVFYHTPTIDDDYGKIYPSAHSSVTTGCIGKAINFNDDIVFFSERGMEGVSGDITTEQVLEHRSSMVDGKLLAEPGYKNMLLEEWEGYLLVIIGNKVFLADSRAIFTKEDHVEYEWFYWELEKQITCTKVHNNVLYLGTTDGVYSLTDADSRVESYWVTPKDKFGYPNHQKTTNKRGCVAEATGDISVYAKTEKTEFELIGDFENVTDFFVSRIKRKKFKDIQLKFYSNTRFSLESVTLECFIGGYIKR